MLKRSSSWISKKNCRESKFIHFLCTKSNGHPKPMPSISFSSALFPPQNLLPLMVASLPDSPENPCFLVFRPSYSPLPHFIRVRNNRILKQYSIPRFGNKRYHGFRLDHSLSLLDHSLWEKPAAKLWAVFWRDPRGEEQSLMITSHEWTRKQIPQSQTNIQRRPQPSWQLDYNHMKDPKAEPPNNSAPGLWLSKTVR